MQPSDFENNPLRKNTRTTSSRSAEAASADSSNNSIKHGLHVLWGTVAGILAALFLGVFFISMGWLGQLPPISDLQNPISKYSSRIYSADGKLMGTWNINTSNRVIVPYDSLPENLVKALVATEDERYYEHSGIDVRAIARAVIKRGILRQSAAGGGSTITQQLAKQLYSNVTSNTTALERLMRKPVEWYIAVQLERHYTKEEIISMYFNYFDFLYNGVGIKNAARTYFDKAPIDLSLEECAMLVGMCKNPSLFNPVRNPERALERRNVVLAQMRKARYLSQAEMEAAQASPVDVSKFHVTTHVEGIAPYFREYLRRIMMAKEPNLDDYPSWNYQKYHDDSLAWETDPLYGWCNKNTKKNGELYNIYTPGLKINTTLDSRMQEYAETATYEHVALTLQKRFDAEIRTRGGNPYSGLEYQKTEQILWRYYRQSERYNAMKSLGASEEELKRIYTKKFPMTLFSYAGDFDTEMSPRDSILYYKRFLRTAMMAMDPMSGAVRAYVPGLDFAHFQYDNCLGGGRRQVGSTIKPFLYSLAMMNGFTPCDVAPNVQRTYGNWTPRNASHARMGEMVTLKWGLSQSNNWISAWVMSQLNPHNLINLMRQMGISNTQIEPTMSLCLGPCDISVGEMVSAYTTFANYGVRTAPQLVTRIEDAAGTVVATFAPRMTEIMPKDEAYKMIDMLRAVIDQGTGRRIRYRYNITADMGGKTGTTNSNADGWFIAFTPRIVVGAWVGGEDRDIHFNSMSNGQGAEAALPIAGGFLKKVYADRKLQKDMNISENDAFVIPDDFNLCNGEYSGLGSAEEPETEEDEGKIDESFQ
jgi:penicillin-binding protein 1A